ncbi:MAG: hypothetical protein AABX86_02070 [Nanoarchaeota archaeon]
MKKQIVLYALAFLVALSIFSALSTKVLFTDAPQYINTAKEFAGLAISKVRNFSAWLYPLFLGQFLKVFPSLFTLQFLNVLWLVLDAILLYHMTKKKEVFLLFAFSPLTWIMAPWINPVVPASFFLLLAYHLLKQYEAKRKLMYFISSGLSLGLVSALWWPGTYLCMLFMLAFFYREKVLMALGYLIPVIATASIRFFIDAYYFGFPFFSTIRGLGSNALYFLDKAEVIPGNPPSFLLFLVMLALVISPFLFKWYQVDKKKHRHELLFLLLATLLFFLNYEIRYFITIAPLVILLLSTVLKKNEYVIHGALSMMLIVVFTASYFGVTEEYLIKQDISEIARKYQGTTFIVGTEGVSEEQAMDISTLYWGREIPRLITYRDWKMDVQKEKVYKEYSIESHARINEVRKMKLSITYLQSDNVDDASLKDLLILGDVPPPEGFELVKKYAIIMQYRKISEIYLNNQNL